MSCLANDGGLIHSMICHWCIRLPACVGNKRQENERGDIKWLDTEEDMEQYGDPWQKTKLVLQSHLIIPVLVDLFPL